MKTTFFSLVIIMVTSITWWGCEYETVPGPVDCADNPVLLELVSMTDATCQVQDGRVEVRASGGTGPYLFRIGNQDEQTGGVFEGLAAGAYELSVADENSCTANLAITLKNKDGLNITFETTDAGCNASNGGINISPVGGIAPYQFKIDDSGLTANPVFTDLFPGNYMVVVSDASGCEVQQSIRVNSGISYATSISKIIVNKCAISGCHSGSQFPDFRVFKNIHDNAAQVKALTGNRTMPQEGTLTQAEIDMIACWVDDGARDN